MTVPAVPFVLVYERILLLRLGLAAGAMIWTVVPKLLSDVRNTGSDPTVEAVSTLAFAALFALQHFMLHA